MTLKQRIENNPVIWLLGSLLASFLAGLSAYQAILVMAQLETVRKNSYVKIEEFRQLKGSIDTLKIEGLCSTVIIDDENSVINAINSTNDSFKLRFLNSTKNRRNCLIRVKSGYCKNEEDTKGWSEPSDWTLKDSKDFSFIIEPSGAYVLKGTIGQFPDNAIKNTAIFYSLIKDEIIE